MITDSGSFKSFDNGNNWQKTEYRLSNVVILDSNIFGTYNIKDPETGSYYNGYIGYIDRKTDKLSLVTYEINGILDTVISDYLATNGEYIVSGDRDFPDRSYGDGGLYISSNKGKDWKKLENFNNKVVSLSIHNNIIFVGADDKHIYSSSNWGNSWDVDTNLFMPVDNLYSHNNKIYASVNKIASQYNVEPGIYVSTDNGLNWKWIHSGIDRINIEQLFEKDDIIFSITDKKSMFESHDNGYNFHRSEIFYDTLVVSNLTKFKDTLFSNGGYRGIQYSIDNGFSWKTYSESLYSQYSKKGRIYKYNSIVIAISQYNTGFQISIDYGNTWRPETTGTISTDPFVGKFLFLDDKIIMTSSLGMKYSYDNGDSWQFYESSNLDSNVSSNLIIRNNDSIYISTSLGLMKSTDNADNWELITSVDVLGEYIGSLDRLEGILYSYVYGKGIYQSKDDGESWEILSTKPLDYPLHNNLQIVEGYFVFTVADGVIVSNDKGNTWEEYFIEKNENEDPIIFYDVEISGDYLIAATNIGVYRTKLSDLGIVKSTVESEIERNYLYTYPPYPNPAKSEVKVLFYWDVNLPMTTDDINIYDITGKKIDSFDKISLVKQANHYGNLIWDCSTAQPGIYLINIKHGTEEKAVKVVVE